jgi:hypothetical protein
MTGGQPVQLSPQQIVDNWDLGLKPLQAIHHQAGNYLVSLKDRHAELFCYDFHLTKRGRDWKIDKFKFNLKYLDGNKDLGSPSDQRK